MSKTVNFLEALEANKTKRVKTDHIDSNWHEVGAYREIVRRGVSDTLQAVTYRWLIEPEVIELECKWSTHEGVIYPALARPEADKLRALVESGAKCKLTIEVLSD